MLQGTVKSGALLCPERVVMGGMEMEDDNLRRSMLIVSADRMPLGMEVEPETVPVAVLSVPGLEQALGVMNSGFRPDVVLIDVRTGIEAVWEFLRNLFMDDWRQVPVLLATEDAGVVFQIAPRDRQRKLPAPSDAHELRALVEFLARDSDHPHVPMY